MSTTTAAFMPRTCVEAPRFRAALTEDDIAAGVTFDVLDGIAKALRRRKGIE